MSDCAVAKGNSGDMVIKVKLGRIRNEVSHNDEIWVQRSSKARNLHYQK